MKSNKWHWILFQILITLLFVYLTFRNTQWHALRDAFYHVSYGRLMPALLLQGFSFFFLGLREKVLLLPLFSFRFLDLMRGVFIGMIGNNILPLRAGEFLKVLYWKKCSRQSYVSLLSIAFLERVFDLICLALLFLLVSHTLLIKLDFRLSWLLIIIACVLLPVLLLLFFDWRYGDDFSLHHFLHRFLGERLTNYCNDLLTNAIRGFRVLGSLRIVFLAIFCSLLYWIFNYFATMAILWSFHLSITWEMPLVVLLVTSLGTAIPSAPGYIGTFDYFAKLSLLLYGVSASAAASYALVMHALLIIPFTFIGLVFVYPVMQQLIRKTSTETLV